MNYTKTVEIGRPYCPECESSRIRLVETIRRSCWVTFNDPNSPVAHKESEGVIERGLKSHYECQSCQELLDREDLDIRIEKVETSA